MRKIVFYTVLIIVQLAFVELTLQLYYRATTGDWLVRRVAIPMFEEDPIRVYRVKANFDYQHNTSEFSVRYTTDNFGFRAANSSVYTHVEKDPDVYRILFLGPSFAFGTAVDYDDMYVTQIVKRLSLPGKKIEAINLGTPSQPVRWQMCWVEEAAAKFEIDLVVQSAYGSVLYGGGACDKSPPLPQIINGYLVKQKSTLRLRAMSVAKQFATVFYSWTIYQMIFRQGDGVEEGLGTDLYARPDGEFNDEMTAIQARSVYSKFVDTVRSGIGSAAKIVVLRIPYGYEIHPEDVSRYASSGMRLTKPESLQKQADSVRSLSAEMPYVFVDPFESLRKNAIHERQYNFIDVHFTPAGNKTVAEHVAPVIQELINSEG